MHPFLRFRASRSPLTSKVHCIYGSVEVWPICDFGPDGNVERKDEKKRSGILQIVVMMTRMMMMMMMVVMIMTTMTKTLHMSIKNGL